MNASKPIALAVTDTGLFLALSGQFCLMMAADVVVQTEADMGSTVMATTPARVAPVSGLASRLYSLLVSYRASRHGRSPAMTSRITVDPSICHGKPCIRGLRYPVQDVLRWLASGMSMEEILVDYADLEREDILAVLDYAARLAHVSRVEPLAT